MKLNPLSLNFKGYGVAPLRGLYMQNCDRSSQRMIFNELKNIAPREHFDVFIHDENDVYKDTKNIPKEGKTNYNFWSQDNKMFIQKNGVDTIIYPKLFRDGQNEEAVELAKKLNMPSYESELILEGGNIFLGKKPDGKNYLIVGEDTFRSSAVYQFLKNRGVKKLNDDKLTDFLTTGRICTSIGWGAELIRVRDFYEEEKYWKNFTKEIFLKDFEVEENDFCVISQPHFHIDLGIRPLEYPYVLVDDKELDRDNIFAFEEEFKEDGEKLTKQFKKALRKTELLYASAQEIGQQLEEKGFKPIFIGGGFGTCKVNFLNAIINKRPNGQLSYISNSTECENEKYRFFQNIFEQELKEIYPKIDRFYFIKGGDYKKGNNVIMSYLNDFKGAIHCLCAERPIFPKDNLK